MKKLAILASHNGSVIEPILKQIEDYQLNCQIKLIITNNSTANVIEKANNNSITCRVINQKLFSNPDQKIIKELQSNNIDLVLLAGYMKKLSSDLVEKFSIINSHPSLLPKYGGVGMYGRFVHKAVIKNNEKSSGVTVHEVNVNYDEGKILLQEELNIEENETPQTLEKKIKSLEATAVIKVLKQLCNKG